MSIIEMDKIKYAEQKEREGEIKGKIKGLELSLEIIKLLKKGVSINEIAEKYEVTSDFVKQISKQII